MEILTGYLYHIKDEFFDLAKDCGLMANHDGSHTRPSYLAIKDNEILWFIPLSTRIGKYQKIVNTKIKKYGQCKTILIRKIAGKEQAILIQNAFPTLEKYIKSAHTVDGKKIKISSNLQRDIIDCLKYTLSLKEEGNNLFFTDIDKILNIISKVKVEN